MASLKIVNEDEEDKIPLDLPAIREGMIRGICATEHALFNHAFFESNRLEKMRRLVNMIEEKVLSKTFPDQLGKTRFVDREIGGVPRVNLCLADVNDGHPDIGALLGNDRHSRSSDISGANTTNL